MEWKDNNNFLNMLKELNEFYLDEVRKFIEIYNYGKQMILRGSEEDYKSILTEVPQVEGEKKYLLEEEEKILSELARVLDPLHFDEVGATKFFEEYYPSVKVVKGKVAYELKSYRYEIFNSPHGYWLKIFKEGDFVTGRTFMMAYDLEKISQILKMFSLFASEKDCKKIDKIIANVEELIKVRSKDNIKKRPSKIRPLSNRIFKNFRILRNMKEFYDILSSSTDGFSIKKLEKIDLDEFVNEVIKGRFGAEFIDKPDKDPEKIFEEKLKPKIFQVLEQQNVSESELLAAKKKVEEAKDKIINFLKVEADELNAEQIVKGVTNPYRAVEILEKMNQQKCESTIVDIQSFINLRNKDVSFRIADLVAAGVKSSKKYIAEGFKEVGVQIVSAIKNSYKEENFDIMLFYSIVRILPQDVLREGFNREIGNDLINLKDVEERSKQMMGYYREYKDEAKETAEEIMREMKGDMEQILNGDETLNNKMEKISQIASNKMIDRIKKRFPEIEGIFDEQQFNNRN